MRRLAPLLTVVLMVAFGFGVYLTLGSQRSTKHTPAATPPPAAAKAKVFTLPGTIYLTQQGALYKFAGGAFTQLQPAGGWMQPALSPDGGRLLVVRRQFNVSDIFLMDSEGHIQSQVTHNGAAIVEVNRWAFYPRFGPTGSIFYSEDQPKVYDYRVDLAVWEIPSGRTQSQGRRWTSPNYFTGGDVNPLPLASGGLMFAKFDVNDAGQSFSQLWLTAAPGTAGTALTQPGDNCDQPAISPDLKRVAMICRGGGQTSLEVADFDGKSFSGLRPVLTGPAVAAPAWSPDGAGLVYFAPAQAGGGNFQLWWVPVPVLPVATPSAAPTPTPSGHPSPASPTPLPTPVAPRQITTGLDLDTTSPPAWKP